MDGKHINFKAPKRDGSLYYNYKNTNSIVLLALSDSNYKFIFTDIGCNGKIKDGGVLSRSDLMQVNNQPEIHFPADENIGNDRKLPYVIIADDAFPLQEHIMKPYPFHTKVKMEQIFNERLSHARQCSEHSFGMLASRFRIFQTNIDLRAEKVKTIVKACCVLHNFLIERSDWQILNSEKHQNEKYSQTTYNHSNANAKNVRKCFAEYFCNEGKVPWQEFKLL